MQEQEINPGSGGGTGVPENGPDQFPGCFEELERRRRRKLALKLAWATPLPGPMWDAFCRPETEACGESLRAVTLGDIVLLAQLKSPLLEALVAKMAGEDYTGQPNAVRLDDFEVAEAALLWTRPHAEARELWSVSPSRFRKTAMIMFSGVREARRQMLAERLVLHLFRSFQTSVALRSPPGNQVETVFQYGESPDGFGWWLCLLGTMMRDFGMSREYALDELPLAQALALQSWSQYTSGLGLELDTDGYIAQEAQAHEAVGKS